MLRDQSGGAVRELAAVLTMATPHVSSICTLLVEAAEAGDPAVRARRVRGAVIGSAHPVPGTTRDETGAGLVDAERALTALRATARSAA
jgi:hypothetical protein